MTLVKALPIRDECAVRRDGCRPLNVAEGVRDFRS